MTILITGAAGFIGFHMSLRLLKEGIPVIGLDHLNDYYDVNLKYSRLAELEKVSKNLFRFRPSFRSGKSLGELQLRNLCRKPNSVSFWISVSEVYDSTNQKDF